MTPLKRFLPASIYLVSLCLFLNQTGSSKATQELEVYKETGHLLLIQNESAGLRGSMAFRITDVRPDSPAARADLQVNDLILAVDDVPVYSREQLDRSLLQPWLNPGAELLITFGRFNPRTGQLEIEKRIIKER